MLSTEVIEHVPTPRVAVSELTRVLWPGGTLVISTPNLVWHWSISVANRLGMRPYQGLENWVSFRDLRGWLEHDGIAIHTAMGFNALPFVHPALYGLINRLDAAGTGVLGQYMVNMAFAGVKRIA